MEESNSSNRPKARFDWKSSDDILREHIKKPWRDHLYNLSWQNLPEIPNKDEISPSRDDSGLDSGLGYSTWNDYRAPGYPVDLPQNIIDGPWPSALEYVSAHYRILREDSIAPLRNAVKAFKETPSMMEDKEINIYTQVTVQGIQLSPMGAAFRVEFSNERAGKRIRWEQSKRLIQGTLVALTPQHDNFQSVCKIAVIAARPMIGLDQNPPQVDIFFGEDKDAVFAPGVKYVMVEAHSSYFEASRHMLEAMQKLMTEKFPLSQHLTLLETNISEPDYVTQRPFLNLCPLLPTEQIAQLAIEVMYGKSMDTMRGDLFDVDITSDFPRIPGSGMDKSQTQALRNMLTKKISIIQGPPGTGKTFVSVKALKVLLVNMKPSDPPIIVTAQTNHALDQLLNHVLAFEPNILRLGGRCRKENKEIRKRTIYELRNSSEYMGHAGIGRGYVRSARKTVDNIIELIKDLMYPLTKDIVTMSTLLKHEIVSQVHYDSVCGGDWVNGSAGEATSVEGFEGWLEVNHLESIPRTSAIDSSLPLEDGEIEPESLAAMLAEAEAHAEGPSHRRDPDDESLTGTWIKFVRSTTGISTGMEDQDVKKLLKNNKDLHAIPIAKRGDIYRYWLKKLDIKTKKDLRGLLSRYRSAVDELRLAKWSSNIGFIDMIGVKLVGCTTTGLSKYRGLIAALQPRTILIEEAAETLEGTIIAGMVDSLHQLILVGDHKQLQANCQVPALGVAPYNMNVSMFERLVNNKIPYVMLNTQRRMIPEIRKLLCVEPNPFYKNLYDHDSVREADNRPPVPGMGGVNCYFFHHKSPEAINADGSKYNLEEARIVACFFVHLILNGVPCEKITILTFYNGQRKMILEELKNELPLISFEQFKCFTVDSYQGEENDVVLLSLVRSNNTLSVGFLENRNRVVVALSRARRGFYMFGNVDTLAGGEGETETSIGREELWTPLLKYMRDISRFNYNNDKGLPLTCQNHKNVVRIQDSDGFVNLAGGCHIKCTGMLGCGHPCSLSCHPFPHKDVKCQEPCPKQLPCRHGCSTTCGETCRCDGCKVLVTNEGEEVDISGICEPSSDVADEFGTDIAPYRHEDSSRRGGPSRDIRNTPHHNSRPNSRWKSAPRTTSQDRKNWKGRNGEATTPDLGFQPQTTIQAWKNWKDSSRVSPPKMPRDGPAEVETTIPNRVYSEKYYKIVVTEDGRRVKTPDSKAPKNIVHTGNDDKEFPNLGSRPVPSMSSQARISNYHNHLEEDLYSASPPRTSAQNGLEAGIKRMELGDAEPEDLMTFSDPEDGV